jgi:hypothetical protein
MHNVDVLRDLTFVASGGSEPQLRAPIEVATCVAVVIP